MSMRVALLIAVGLLATWSAGAAQPAATSVVPAPDRTQLERKLESVTALTEKSSAAKQIDASGSAAARERREQARALRAQAAAALQAGDLAAAGRLLDEAARAMFDAVRLSAPDQVTRAKKRADFDARMESVQVLLEAQRRIGSEKQTADAAQTSRRIEAQVQEAKRLADAGDLDAARAILDQAYLTAKSAIGGMREGDTLVRTLTFASKEEEYRYELDRNDTHQMLIKVLLDEKREAGNVDKMVRAFQDKAVQLRREAEARAARKDFDGAVRLLEQSTAELVRAIRGAGVYIPG